jgi:hypothetical protein
LADAFGFADDPVRDDFAAGLRVAVDDFARLAADVVALAITQLHRV